LKNLTISLAFLKLTIKQLITYKVKRKIKAQLENLEVELHWSDVLLWSNSDLNFPNVLPLTRNEQKEVRLTLGRLQ